MKTWVCLFLAPVFSILLLFSLATVGLGQGVTGNIRGTVVDSSGGVIPGATVKITNINTGLTRTVTSGTTGIFVASLLPPGTYNVTITKEGFKTFTQSGVLLQAAATYVVSATLEVGAVAQTVEVKAAPIQIDKTTMQLGGELAGTQVTNFPLLNLNWLNLQQTLPGVMASSDRFGNNFATNGNRTQSNDYMINGTDANDAPLNTPFGGGVNPLNPDAIQEVKVVDSTLDPQYGRNSGAIVNVVTKSGTNQFHGTAYDYYRDTTFNARTFFQPTTPPFHQNQFGATIGGPILHNKVFFFFGYQGVRLFQGLSANTPVFSAAERTGDWSASVGGLIGTDVSPFPLYGDAKSPCPVSSGLKCPAQTQYSQLFSTGVIPSQDFNPIALDLMNKYVPLPNTPAGTYAFANNNTFVSDQYLGRLDFHFTSNDSAYFFFMVQPLNNPSTLPFTGATLPGFGSTSHQNIYRYTLSETHIISPEMVNEFRIGWQRFNFVAVNPQTPTLPSSAGFDINPQDPAGAGLPVIALTGYFTLGFSENGPQPRIDDTGELTDNLSFVHGKHDFKVGADVRRSSVYNPFFFLNSGVFSFGGSGTFTTGLPGMDYLLGIPDSYNQSSGNIINARTWLIYSYAQDQWQIRPDLTLTYGVGWQVNTPLTDLYNNGVSINAFNPTKQSRVFPLVTDSSGKYVSGAPQGLLFPGDVGVNSAGGVVTHLSNFAPRLGFAYNPIQKFVIRGGWGIYYDNSEEELTLQNLIAPPFALIDAGVGDIGYSPSFAAPFTSVNPTPVCVANCGNSPTSENPPVVAGAGSIPNKYPFTPPKPGQAVDFSFFYPMSLNVTEPNFNVPYVMNMNLTTQYQLTPTTVITVGYVGSLGRKLEGVVEGNPYNVQSYLNACDPANTGNFTAQANSEACISGRTFGFYNYPNIGVYGSLIPTNEFGSVGTQSTFLTSNYNSLQVSVQKAMSHGLYIRGAYTYGHALDYGSSFENSQGLIDPFNYALAYGDSQYDARQRLVIQYQYNIPNWSFGVLPSRLTKGWGFSGITTFQTGFPIQLSESDYRSYGCSAAITFYGCWDRPQVTGTPVQNFSNPRTSTNHLWFNTNGYARENYGTVGNAGRNVPFHGPGINDFDMSFWKDTAIVEDVTLQLRLDMFNVWNHANFANPSGNVVSSTFGQVLNTTGNARILQLSAHLYF
jgi:hypothetical protein